MMWMGVPRQVDSDFSSAVYYSQTLGRSLNNFELVSLSTERVKYLSLGYVWNKNSLCTVSVLEKWKLLFMYLLRASAHKVFSGRS